MKYLFVAIVHKRRGLLQNVIYATLRVLRKGLNFIPFCFIYCSFFKHFLLIVPTFVD